MNVLQIAPLKDDTSEWRDKSLWRDLIGFFFTNSVLAWRLKQQLKSRPNVWGIGLWPDAEHEEVAKICAEGLDAGFGCESINFIPACFARVTTDRLTSGIVRFGNGCSVGSSVARPVSGRLRAR